jgi:PHS family inorganic phosphate transporter-like MFS transporter
LKFLDFFLKFSKKEFTFLQLGWAKFVLELSVQLLKSRETLIGTASCWFLLDVAFYGTNLNQSVLLADIGFSTGKTHWDAMMKNGVGDLIIAASGYMPGYFFTVALIEKSGRRWIQLQGFLMVALMFAILAGGYGKLGTAGKLFVLRLQR